MISLLLLCQLVLSQPIAAASPSQSLLVDFEDGQLPARFVVKSPRSNSIQVQKSIVRSGVFAARFELRSKDVFISNGHKDGFRAELKDPYRAPIGREAWYALSVYIPVDFPIHENRLVIAQWNAEPDPGEQELERSPPLSIRYSNGALSVRLFFEVDSKEKFEAKKITLFEQRSFPKGKWHDFVFQVKWSYQKDGFIKAWLNKSEIIAYNGPVGYRDKIGPYFKFGLYRDDVPETYIIYFDNYRRGESKRQINE